MSPTTISSTPKPLADGVFGREPRVLVVEDAEDSRELLTRELRLAGFAVVEAENGAQAIDRARTYHPDVIVLDLMLPDVNGITVAQVVRHLESLRFGGILAVTALTSPGIRSAALAAGCDSFIAKPTSASVVVDEVRRIVEAHSGDPQPSAPPSARSSIDRGGGKK
jgi:DNA-binding response OmpR family regulator